MCYAAAGVAWRKLLVDVDNDLESCYLAAHRDKMEFVLSVPNHGMMTAAACSTHHCSNVARSRTRGGDPPSFLTCPCGNLAAHMLWAQL
jgi:hypothetical protein